MLKYGEVLVLSFKRYLSVQVSNRLPLSKTVNNSLDVTFRNIDQKYKIILDVRSPLEYSIDHLPGAINIPILDNDERSDVGKSYSENPVVGRFLGSSLIMKNLSQYLLPDGILFRCLHDRVLEDDDRVIVYCAKGGKRSKSVAIVLSEIGFMKQPINILAGGYRAYRQQVMEDLEKLPQQITFVGICGLTGTAKTKILHCLRECGETVLDLEGLAKHKGSVFGACVDNFTDLDGELKIHQPSQKCFDSKLWSQLTDIVNNSSNGRRCKEDKPIVWIECESRNIGKITIGDSLWRQMQSLRRIIVETTVEERVKHLLADYDYLVSDKYLRFTKMMIKWLSASNSQTLNDRWSGLAEAGKFDEMVESMLVNHYDPIYTHNRRMFISCTDRNMVERVFVESLDYSFIKDNICSKFIEISSSWLQ